MLSGSNSFDLLEKGHWYGVYKKIV